MHTDHAVADAITYAIAYAVTYAIAYAITNTCAYAVTDACANTRTDAGAHAGFSRRLGVAHATPSKGEADGAGCPGGARVRTPAGVAADAPLARSADRRLSRLLHDDWRELASSSGSGTACQRTRFVVQPVVDRVELVEWLLQPGEEKDNAASETLACMYSFLFKNKS